MERNDEESEKEQIPDDGVIHEVKFDPAVPLDEPRSCRRCDVFYFHPYLLRDWLFSRMRHFNDFSGSDQAVSSKSE